MLLQGERQRPIWTPPGYKPGAFLSAPKMIFRNYPGSFYGECKHDNSNPSASSGAPNNG
jgi:hypothetical protein